MIGGGGVRLSRIRSDPYLIRNPQLIQSNGVTVVYQRSPSFATIRVIH
jgi:hypothetical protein